MLRDKWGPYTPSPPPVRTNAFPCEENPCCTNENRLCHNHKKILFVSVFDSNLEADCQNKYYKIPYGNWENFNWYAARISEVTGLPLDSFRIIFAGCERFPDGSKNRHLGLQSESIIHVTVKLKSAESLPKK